MTRTANAIRATLALVLAALGYVLASPLLALLR